MTLILEQVDIAVEEDDNENENDNKDNAINDLDP